jgi:hypothetical protein
MAEADSTAPLSIDDAVALMIAEPDQEAEAADTPAEGEEAAPEATDEPAEAVEGEEQAEEAEDDADDDGETEEVNANAPFWWDAEAKAHFNTIPRNAKTWAMETQRIVAEQEAKREAVVQKAKSEARDRAEAANREIEAVRGVLSRLDGAAPGEIAQFEQDYKDVDWNALPKWAEENPEAANQWLAQYNARRAKVERLIDARAEAEKLESESFARQQAERLREIAPDIATDPVLRALGDYLPKTGIPAEAMKNATAEELVILNKARLYDEMQSKAAVAAKSPKVKASPPTKPVKPVAAPVTGTFKQRQALEAVDRVKKTGSMDDAVDAIMKLGL